MYGSTLDGACRAWLQRPFAGFALLQVMCVNVIWPGSRRGSSAVEPQADQAQKSKFAPALTCFSRM